MLGRTPDGILAVRPLKDGVIADFDVTEKMLRFFLKTIIDRHLFRVKPKVIVCVPSGITEVEKRAVRDSAQSAGAKEVYMVAEPMAAAIGVGLPVETPTGNMVIDIGGGTTEIAVIALSGIVSDTSIRTGGDELDQAIVQFMRKNYNLLVGEPTAEATKIKIGSAAPTGDEREMEVKGRGLVSGITKTVRVQSTATREAGAQPTPQLVDAVPGGLAPSPPALGETVLAPVVWLQARAEEGKTSRERFRIVTAQRDSASYLAQGIPSLIAENERLRLLLSLSRRLSSSYVAAEVLHQAQATDGRTLLLSAGARDGVAAFDPVVAPEGLIGVVLNVAERTSVVMTWAHPEVRVSAFTVTGNAAGVVAPSESGDGEEGLEFRGVPYRDSVPVGTLVLSSG